jgi:hypothetical protein
MRIIEKRGDEYEPPPRRRRPAPPDKADVEDESVESTAHKIDDLA